MARNYTPGQERQHPNLNTHSPGPVQNVRDPQYGAVADWNGTTGTDAGPAIKTAMDRAGDGGHIYIPAGDYRLATVIRPEYDGMTVEFAPGANMYLDMDSYGLLVNRTEPRGGIGTPLATRGVSIIGGTFYATNGKGPHDAGIVQLNNCKDLTVRDLTIIGDDSLKGTVSVDGRRTNGIAMSQGTGGVLSNVVVDGVPKPGIYVSTGCVGVKLVACVAKNVTGYYAGGVLVEAPGFGIGGCVDVDIIGCSAHNNVGNGMQITVIGTDATGTPAENIRVIGGSYHDNGEMGILLGATVSTLTAMPNHIVIADAQVYANGDMGIDIGRGWRVRVHHCEVYANGGIGIRVSDNDATLTTIYKVYLLQNAVYNNGQSVNNAGIYIRGGQYVYVRDNVVYDDGSGTQVYGIQTVKGDGGVNAPAPCFIERNHVHGNATAQYQWTTALASGRVEITAAGAPGFAAPKGSVYYRTDGGAGTTLYVNEAGGTTWAAK